MNEPGLVKHRDPVPYTEGSPLSPLRRWFDLSLRPALWFMAASPDAGLSLRRTCRQAGWLVLAGRTVAVFHNAQVL